MEEGTQRAVGERKKAQVLRGFVMDTSGKPNKAMKTHACGARAGGFIRGWEVPLPSGLAWTLTHTSFLLPLPLLQLKFLKTDHLPEKSLF